MLTSAACKQLVVLRTRSNVASYPSVSSPPCHVAACSSSKHEQPLWVFQAEPARGSNYSLLDVRDAIEACSPATSPEERSQCFLNFGLKAEMVDRYYDHVMRMEEAMEERPSEEDVLAQRMVRVAGFLLFLMVGCKVV